MIFQITKPERAKNPPYKREIVKTYHSHKRAQDFIRDTTLLIRMVPENKRELEWVNIKGKWECAPGMRK